MQLMSIRRKKNYTFKENFFGIMILNKGLGEEMQENINYFCKAFPPVNSLPIGLQAIE